MAEPIMNVPEEVTSLIRGHKLTRRTILAIRKVIRGFMRGNDGPESITMIKSYRKYMSLIEPVEMSLTIGSDLETLRMVAHKAKHDFVSLTIEGIRDNQFCLSVVFMIRTLVSLDPDLFLFNLKVTPLVDFQTVASFNQPNFYKDELRVLIKDLFTKGRCFRSELDLTGNGPNGTGYYEAEHHATHIYQSISEALEEFQYVEYLADESIIKLSKRVFLGSTGFAQRFATKVEILQHPKGPYFYFPVPAYEPWDQTREDSLYSGKEYYQLPRKTMLEGSVQAHLFAALKDIKWSETDKFLKLMMENLCQFLCGNKCGNETHQGQAVKCMNPYFSHLLRLVHEYNRE